ncbi:MAG TPA: ATP-binding protein [Ignavibacteria bacterium]|mgnify:CR=1 FL=1|nr:ATP-binding protein [Ignavibacteria bacterium]
MVDLYEDLYNFNPWWEEEYRPDLIKREKFLNIFRASEKRKEILIITGLRRVGKSSLIKLFIKELVERVEPKKILYVSLDSISIEKYSVHEIVREFRKLHQLKRNEKIYLFFDEAAYRKNINQELKSLYDNENVKIYVSSSSATILRDKNALLTGRTKIVEVLPLDFFEFLMFKNLSAKKSEEYLTEKFFEEFMMKGGIPEFILSDNFEYLDNLVDAIIYKDIAFYHGVKDLSSLKEFFRLLMERSGKQASLNKISNVLGISSETAKRYFEYFQNTYLIYAIERCGKLNERLRAPKKVYAADLGIKNLVTGFRDKGAIFENLVFFLIKDKLPCYIYKNGIELDFHFDNALIEVKYNREIEDKQKALFENIKIERKFLISNVKDFLDFQKNIL